MSTRDLRQHLAQGGAAVFDLSTRTKIRLTGADRVRYLNGQVSNDVRKLKAGETLQACIMTAKGKMKAAVWITAGADYLQIDAEPGLSEDLQARLERYIISDDVTLTDVTHEFALAHVLGASKEAFLAELPEGISATAANRFAQPGFDLLIPTGAEWPEGTATFTRTEGGIRSVIVPTATAETYRIEQGVPVWGLDLDENTIPVEAGLEATSIDYHKGCYIGQEVISRIKSVGHVNRHLHGFILPSPLPSGTRLQAEGRDVGLLTSVTFSEPLSAHIALGYLKRGFEEAPLTAQSAADSESAPISVQRHNLPFLP